MFDANWLNRNKKLWQTGSMLVDRMETKKTQFFVLQKTKSKETSKSGEVSFNRISKWMQFVFPKLISYWFVLWSHCGPSKILSKLQLNCWWIVSLQHSSIAIKLLTAVIAITFPPLSWFPALDSGHVRRWLQGPIHVIRSVKWWHRVWNCSRIYVTWWINT